MDNATLLYAAASAVGGALVVGAREIWTWFKKRTEGETVAKGETIAALEATIAHERAERAREQREAQERLAALGRRLDATTATLERERLQAAGVVQRMREDKSVDDALADDMPTAVRDRADLIAPRKPSSVPPIVHPETNRELRRYARPDLASTPPDPKPVIPAHRQGRPKI